MNSNNFIEIKINMEHVFLSRLPALTFFPHTHTPGGSPPQATCLVHSSGLDGVWDTEFRSDHQKRTWGWGSGRADNVKKQRYHSTGVPDPSFHGMQWKEARTRSQESWVLAQVQPVTIGVNLSASFNLLERQLCFPRKKAKLPIFPVLQDTMGLKHHRQVI